LGLEIQSSSSQQSPAAQHFLASGGLVQDEEIAMEVQVKVQSSARAPILFPTHPVPVDLPKGKVISLSRFSSSALSLFNCIKPAFLWGLDLNLDRFLPPYLGLSTAIHILKLCIIKFCQARSALGCIFEILA
jgi:hypothetical protein